jgi:membrane protease YdiL (CAAX protease family)
MSDEPQLPIEPEPIPEVAPERDPFWGYADVAVFAGSALPCLLLGYGIVKVVSWLFHWKAPSEAWVLLPAQALGYLLLFGVLFLIFRIYGRPFWRSLGWVTPSWPAALVAGAGFGAAIVVVFLGNVINTPNAENEITKLMKDPVSLVLMALFGVLIAPLCEELAFRGFLQPLLVRSFGIWPGIVGAAIPFGLLHFREYGNSWRHALLISLAGGAFGWMRQKTGSTMASTVMHAAYNALFFAAFFAAKSTGKL